MLDLEAVDHDEAIAMEVGKRLELGCFAEQIVNYGTCFVQNQKTQYFISDNAENVHNFMQGKLEEGIYCLPTVRRSKTMLIPSGERASLTQSFKVEAARMLQWQHAGNIMEQIQILAPRNTNAAAELLDELCGELHGCFAEESLYIFEGLVETAYYAGKLTAYDYIRYHDWLKLVRTTVEAEAIVHDTHERTYTGFAYVDETGNTKYYYNAVRASTLERKCELQKKKLLVTPIFQKWYSFQQVGQFRHVVDDFKQKLRTIYSATYMAILKELYGLPSTLDQIAFGKVYDRATAENNILMQDALNYYGSLWQLW